MPRPTLRTLLALLALPALLAIPAVLRAESPTTAPAQRRTFTNPIGPGADPWLFYYDHHYYYTFTAGRTLILRKSTTLAGLKDAPETLLYQAPPAGPNADHLWAPELHLVAGHWYVYYTATDGPDAHHRMFTLRSQDTRPEGPYENTGPLKGMSDDWAIDATLLTLPPPPSSPASDLRPLTPPSRLYLLWSGWQHPPSPESPDTPGGPQSIYIAPMSDPLTVSGPRVLLSEPTHDWETQGWKVNEGPEALQHDGKTFVVFSASLAATRNYCLALLTLTGQDPLDPKSWAKSDRPVFSEYEGPTGHVYGPGHCSFFKSPDGTEDWIAYHAKNNPERQWRGRTTRAQPFTWNPDGTPRFAHPVPPRVPLPVPSGEPAR